MEKSIERFTDAEIINEAYRRFSGRVCIWVDEDVAEKLDEFGYERTKENIDAVWSRAAHKWLSEDMCEAGFATIERAIDYVRDQLTEVEED